MAGSLQDFFQGWVDPGLIELLESVGFHDPDDLAHVDPAGLHAELLRANHLLKLMREVPNIEQITALKKVAQSGHKPSLVELLEAVGFNDAEALAKADPATLHAELVRANSLLKLTGRVPDVRHLQTRVEQARKLDPILAADDAALQRQTDSMPREDGAVDYEQQEHVLAMIEGSPFALPLPAKLLAAGKIAVSTIPKGLLLSCHVGDLEVRVTRDAPGFDGPREIRSDPGEENGPDLDWSRLRQTGAPDETAVDGKRKHDLMRAPRESTNAGKDPQSRWFIRGVLHSSPRSLYLSAVTTLWISMLLPCSLIAALLLALCSAQPERFAWVPGWLVWIPVALVPSGLAYLIWGLSGRCIICKQKFFSYFGHHKHSRAHRLPGGFGHVVAMCLHLLVFRWFRCANCGTSVRIKE